MKYSLSDGSSKIVWTQLANSAKEMTYYTALSIKEVKDTNRKSSSVLWDDSLLEVDAEGSLEENSDDIKL